MCSPLHANAGASGDFEGSPSWGRRSFSKHLDRATKHVPPSTRLQHRCEITAPGGVKPQRPPTLISAVPDPCPGHDLTCFATRYPGPPETCRPPSFMDPVFAVKTLQSTRGPVALPGSPSHVRRTSHPANSNLSGKALRGRTPCSFREASKTFILKPDKVIRGQSPLQTQMQKQSNKQNPATC